MPNITRTTRYLYAGKAYEYRQLEEFLINGIGAIIDTASGLGPKQRIAVLDALHAHEGKLLELLLLRRELRQAAEGGSDGD